ncbi:LacI family DNA-binding transcriptional regulator [Streptomyces radicis]|uniref:DeoR family transcriptional regulator n=1 Tax=Streptomyces radicis TaxID=1750517 RepID=A0A3A9WIP7_9ACTN|nr:LacI family DNA-binding transcriptional regulator [Streptomyces radicis]RKN05977.1 DeoR family transcriptional regulator [Streptomyces radicis]RKN17715.1 DeoR family transcriptional regulator [Streptomyces radicis]
MTDMLATERHGLLVKELEASGVLKITELAARLGVSRATIRRDLMDLEAAGLVTRVRGGAVLAASEAVERSAGVAGVAGAATEPTAGTGPQVLGLLVPAATHYYPSVVAGVRAVAATRGARVVISLTDYAQTRDLDALDELNASSATGLLIASADGHHPPRGALDRLRARGLPFVLLERQPDDGFAPSEFVASDHRQGAFAAVRHLVNLGHDKVGLFTNGGPTAPLIREGYEAAVRLLPLAPSSPAVDSGSPVLGSTRAAATYDRFLAECRATGTRAALVHSDHDAIELMRRMRAQGLGVPDDLALVAYEDEIASLADVPLTAVAPYKRELGEEAARLLLDRLASPAPGAVPVRQLFLQPRLVVRASCGAADRL